MSDDRQQWHSLEKEVDGPLVMGRGAVADIVVKREDVSRRHCQLILEGDTVLVSDLKSTNGTWTEQGGQWLRIEEPTQIALPALLRIGREANVRIESAEEIVNIVATSQTGATRAMDVESSLEISSDSLQDRCKEVSILVLDLCASTDTAEKEGDLMAYHLKRRLESIVRPICDQHGVDFFKNTGDGFFATFVDAVDAFKTATTIMGDLKERNQSTTNPDIDVRIALHSGAVYVIDEDTQDLHGTDLNLAFRLEGVKEANFTRIDYAFPPSNRILSTAQFREKVEQDAAKGNSDVLAGTQFSYCGKASLKGISNPVDVYYVGMD